MRSWTWLMRLAATVWLAWLGLVGLLFGMLRLGAWHPHFLPVTAVLVVLLVSTLSLLIVGMLAVGPRPAEVARAGVLAAWPAAPWLSDRAPDVWLRHRIWPPVQAEIAAQDPDAVR